MPLIRDAQIVALTDATHGTHEFFDVKQRLIPMLAPDVIAFEAPYAEWQGTDPATFIQSADYWFWDAQEVLDTIEWAQNRGVQIFGIDCAHPHPAIDMVLAYLGRLDPAERQTAADEYSCLSRYAEHPWDYYAQTSTDAKAQCRAAIALVRPEVESHRADYESRSSHDEFERVFRAARVVEQGEVSLNTPLQDNRDACMAENIEWLASRNPGRRIVIWGHNEHFGKTAYDAGRVMTSTGTYLAETFGSRFMAIATVALQGSFWALKVPTYVITEQQLSPRGADDYAAFLSAAGLKEMFVSLAGVLPPFLRAPHTIRIGGTSGPASLIENLPQRFDAIIYFETSTPSQLRHFPHQIRN